MPDLPTLGWPRCPYCKYTCDLNSAGFYCFCDGYQIAKQVSAEAMHDRMIREHGWQEQDLLQEIQKESKQ